MKIKQIIVWKNIKYNDLEWFIIQYWGIHDYVNSFEPSHHCFLF